MDDRDFLLRELHRFVKENGRNPGYNDLRNYNGYPSNSAYTRTFGSVRKGLITAGLLREDGESEEFLLSEIERFKEENKRLPTHVEMCTKKGYPTHHAYERVFGSWKNALIAGGYVLEHDNTEEYLIRVLRKYNEENGRYPMQRDMTIYNGYPSIRCFLETFGSWSNALKAADMDRMDQDFFKPENMNLRKWYIIGYIIADGWVNKNYIRISTVEKDKDNLYAMNDYIEKENNMIPRKKYVFEKRNLYFKDKVYKAQPVYQIQFHNKYWIKDLMLYGIVENKTHISYIPLDYLKTPEEEAAIMRGIFDGDGSISVDVNHWIDGKTTTHHPIFKLTGSKKLCEDYAFLLEKNCGVKPNILPERSVFQIRTSGIPNCTKIFNFLYGHENFFIQRKKERLVKLLNGVYTPEGDNY